MQVTGVRGHCLCVIAPIALDKFGLAAMNRGLNHNVWYHT